MILFCASGLKSGGVHAGEEGYSLRAQEVRRFDVPSQRIDASIAIIAEQGALQISAAAEDIFGKVGREVRGSFTAEAALSLWLEDTGLAARRVAERTYVIVKSVAQDEGKDGNVLLRSAVAEDAVSEVLVTGSHIRGVAPVGAPLRSIGRREIEAGGYRTVHEVVQSLPFTHGMGPNEDTTTVRGSDPDAGTNIGFGSSINLRGLGADATLVLVNGRRAAAGAFGEFVDVSMIPVAAIERVEVLVDGASAVYGADAVGGVVNIVLRRDLEGAETGVRYGGVTSGSADEVGASQLLGWSWGGGAGVSRQDGADGGEVDGASAVVGYAYRRRDALGSEERAYTANSDLRPLGGTDRGSVFGNPGNITNGAVTYAIPRGQDGRDLEATDLLAGQRNLQNTREGTDVLPEQVQHALFGTVRQQVGAWGDGVGVELFGDARYAERTFASRVRAAFATIAVPSTNPFYVNPFGGGPVAVQYSFGRDLGPILEGGRVRSWAGAGGARVSWSESWGGEVALSYSEERTSHLASNLLHTTHLTAALADADPARAFNPFGDGSNSPSGTIESIRGFVETRNAFALWSVDAKADGRVMELPGGALKVAVGAHYREERLTREERAFRVTEGPVERAEPVMRREVAAGFAEVSVPLASTVRMSLAGRAEKYSDFGWAVNPKLGAEWQAAEGLRLRGTYGRSFKAPAFVDLDDSGRAINLTTVADPTAASGTALAVVVSGNNAGLSEERARTWTMGVDFDAPAEWRGVGGMRVQGTWFDIAFEDRIARPPSALGVLALEDDYASIIARDPDAATVNQLFADPAFRGVPVDPAFVDVVIDGRALNLARTRVRGLDVSVAWSWETGFGELSAALEASHLVNFSEALTDRSVFRELAGTLGAPVDTRARVRVGVERGPWSGTLFVNHHSAYRDTVSEPDRRVRSWTTLDARVGRSLAGRGAVTLGVENLLDESPPMVDHVRGVAFDPQNADPLGRFLSVEATWRW